MKDFAPFRKKSTNIGSCIHGSGENIGVLLRGLRLANQTTENSRERDSFLHSAARRRWSEGLKMKGQIMFDRSARLDGLNLERSTDVG